MPKFIYIYVCDTDQHLFERVITHIFEGSTAAYHESLDISLISLSILQHIKPLSKINSQQCVHVSVCGCRYVCECECGCGCVYTCFCVIHCQVLAQGSLH